MPSADPDKITPIYDEFKKFLTDTIKIECPEETMANLDRLGFFSAPASTANHCHHDGGLAEHSWNVFVTVKKLAATLGLSVLDQDRLQLLAILHDLGKTGYQDQPYYTENILKSGKRSDAKPFNRSGELAAMHHEIRSLLIASELGFRLSPQEQQALVYHAGQYDPMSREIESRETPYMLVLHMADNWVTKVTEKTEANVEQA